MKPLFSYSIKTGLMALGLAAGLSAPAHSGPMPQTVPSVPSSITAAEIVPVRDSWAGGNSHRDYWRHNRGNSHWQGNQWRRNNWHRPYYRDNWHGHRNYRRHYGGSGIYFGLGGFGLGPAYDYYAPNYYYVPRRTYRVYRGSNAHVRWCYNRYRSYRASDNTFQPYHGPRQQCYSPYR
jgi:hypothetical protein